jgi:Protein of unknown function (DUF1553)/Protein of unknown function (DUF1549)/Planctomycete cytochrome C/Concanavalin A-like lectin/glucanases superfamily
MTRRPFAILFGFIAAIAVALMWHRAPADERSVYFDRRIGPLLVSRCFECHSGTKPKGGLDLSRRKTAIAGGESGRAIVPGSPAASLLWQRVAAGEMPPKKPLAADEQSLIKDWISRGAQWGTDPIDPFRVTTTTRAGYDWWSLQPVVRPRPPATRHDEVKQNPIDSFVLAKLEASGLTLSPPADRRTLIRRLTFDLTGLPPSPNEVAAFVLDSDPRAYERLVDRLLASPHYGERWARHWLDLARFGESNGFEYDEPRRNAWPYRDWLIAALNRDLPFEEFARQQIAGDVLAPGDPDALTATGFLVAGAYDTAGQNQQSAAMKAVVRQDELEDLVSTVSQTFLGLTAHCARCHDHKFDPIRQTDYYRLTSALGGVRHGERDLTTPAQEREQLRRTRARERRIDELTARLESIDEPVRQRILSRRRESQQLSSADVAKSRESTTLPPLASWEFDRDLRDSAGRLHARTLGGAQIRDGGLGLNGNGDFAATVPLDKELRAKTLEVWVSLKTLQQAGGGAISVQTLDGSIFDAIVFGEREPGCWMAGSDNFARTQSFDGPRETEAANRPVVITVVYANDGTITGYRNGRLYGHSYRSAGPAVFKAGRAQVVFGLRHGPPGGNKMLAGVLERAQLYDRALSAAEVAASAARQVDLLPDQAVVAELSTAARAKRQRLAGELRDLQDNPPLPAKRISYAITPRQPEPARFLVRGDIRQPTNILAPGGIASLAGVSSEFHLPPDAPEAQRRLALADWLASARNPLFARVIVNRLWQHHFGVGLVDTPNDFGFNGGRPSHPELLDWLAATLVERNWSLKRLQREIVLSATYRQSCADNARAMKQDADNRWLWRRNPQRLEAEAIRDAVLAAAGQLRQTIGGPGFRDFKEIFRAGTYTYEPAETIDPTCNRRTIYRTWTRGGRSGLLDAFDCPDPSVTAPKRAVTTTPLQALALFNDAFTLRMATRLAQRAQRAEPGNVDGQITRAYQWSFGRDPSAEEQIAARRLVTTHGLAALARAIFNSNEFLYVD